MEQAKIPERYTLIAEVGHGGMAVVYRAQDETLKREVAIKVLHQHLANEAESKARLEREAQAVAKLRHENIVEIFDYSGNDSASAYIVTEFIDGITLKEFLEAHPLRYPEVAALVAAEIGGALAHAHGLGIIHRDVKPENVMIRKDGLLKLMDFGIAQVVDLQRMTVTGQLLGSPAYMAPELIEGKALDFRTDVFSVGIMLYQLATGSLPFSGKNPHEVLRRITEGKFPDPRSVNRRVSDGLARVIARALARRPDDRHPEVGALVDELHELLGEAGVSDVRGELRSFFADPAGYEAALPARLAGALTASAAKQLAARRSAKAIELWNRVLAFDPDNAVVLAALRRLEGRTRLRTAGLALVGAGVLGAAAFGLASLRKPETGPLARSAGPAVIDLDRDLGSAARGPASVARNEDRPRPLAATLAEQAPVAPRAAVPRRAEPERRTPPADPRPPRDHERDRAEVVAAGGGVSTPGRGAPLARTFILGPTPQNVDVYLDGAKQFAYDTDHKSLTVGWTGDHVIEFRSPSGCCFVEKIEVGPNRPLPPDSIIARRLKWRPAHLQVTTEPAAEGARIVIRDPNRRGTGMTARAGEEVDIPFLADDEPSKEIEVAVDTGEVFASEQVSVRAGQRLTHVVKLKSAGQQ